MASGTTLSGKTALITGASRGIGSAIARAFAEAGADLVLVARSAEEMEQAASVYRQGGSRVRTESVDLADHWQIESLFSSLDANGIRLDVLVNNAAVMIKGLIESYAQSDLRTMLAVNVEAPYLLSQKAIPMMKSRGGGAIVNISSLSGCFGVQKFPGFGAYDMTKYALWGLTEMLAIEHMADNIRVNQLSLSAVDTDMFRSVAPEKLKASLKAADVARHVLYLASEESAPLTGENVILTGMAPAR